MKRYINKSYNVKSCYLICLKITQIEKAYFKEDVLSVTPRIKSSRCIKDSHLNPKNENIIVNDPNKDFLPNKDIKYHLPPINAKKVNKAFEINIM